MSEFDKRGSIATFVVVGVVLVALLIGGIYLAKSSFSDHKKSKVAVVNNSKVEDKSTKQSSNLEKSKTANSDKRAKQTGSTAKGADESGKKATSKSTVSTESKSSENTVEMSRTGVDTQATQELPKTGIGENLMSIVLLGVLVGVATVYYRSERAKV